MSAKIFWAIIGGFLIGVLTRSFVPLPTAFSLFVSMLALAALVLAHLDASKQRAYLLIAIALGAGALGMARMQMASLVGNPTLSAHVEEKVILEGVVFDEPDTRDTGVHLPLRAESLSVGGTTYAMDAKVLVFAPPHVGISYGDRMRAEGVLRIPQKFDTDGGRQFDYPSYLAKDGIAYQLSFAHVEKLERGGGNFLKSWVLTLKQAYLRGGALALPEPEAGLAGGITVGDKRSIGLELAEDFQKVSLIHIVVLSGYNITVVINAIGSVLTHAPRMIGFGASGAVVLFFILVSGGASSAIRAGLMAFIAVYARTSGRVFLAARALGVVAVAMVVWNPMLLAFDPGFQLSVLATIGLISFTPLVSSRLEWVPERLGLREIVSSTIATQFTVLPLLLYQNGNLSLVALPANVLALIPVPFAMLFSFVAAVGGMVFGSHAIFLGVPAYALLAYIISVARFFAALPFASVSIPAFSAWWMLAAYGILFGALWYIKKKRAGAVLPPKR